MVWFFDSPFFRNIGHDSSTALLFGLVLTSFFFCVISFCGELEENEKEWGKITTHQKSDFYPPASSKPAH